MMEIEINLFATLVKYKPDHVTGRTWTRDVAEGTTLSGLLAELEIPESEVKLMFLNGVAAKLPATLENGDRVGFFPPVGGG